MNRPIQYKGYLQGNYRNLLPTSTQHDLLNRRQLEQYEPEQDEAAQYQPEQNQAEQNQPEHYYSDDNMQVTILQ